MEGNSFSSSTLPRIRLNLVLAAEQSFQRFSHMSLSDWIVLGIKFSESLFFIPLK